MQNVTFYPLGWYELPFRDPSLPAVARKVEELNAIWLTFPLDISKKPSVDWERFDLLLIERPMCDSDQYFGVRTVKRLQNDVKTSLLISFRTIPSDGYAECVMWNLLSIVAISKGPIHSELIVEEQKKPRVKRQLEALWSQSLEKKQAEEFNLNLPLSELIALRKNMLSKNFLHSSLKPVYSKSPYIQQKADIVLLSKLDETILNAAKKILDKQKNAEFIYFGIKHHASNANNELEVDGNRELLIEKQLKSCPWYSQAKLETQQACLWYLIVTLETTMQEKEESLQLLDKRFRLIGSRLS